MTTPALSTYLFELEERLQAEDSDKWFYRSQKSAHHLLAAICFRENSQSIWEETRTVLLPPIGFYYSIFHLSMAMLFLDYQTDASELKRIRHATLKNLINQRLMQKRLLANSYLDEFQHLQDIREYANYNFGSKVPKYEYLQIADAFYPMTGKCFDQVIDLIHPVQIQIDDFYSFSMSIQTAIGDGFGDDLMRMYLPKDVEEKVVVYLLEKNLTT
jgi:uncharacterized protein (UPF0332 family)